MYEELARLQWPDEFVVEYVDGERERLFRGAGVTITTPEDDPEGVGCFDATLPQQPAGLRKELGRAVRFSELRTIFSPDGHRLWPLQPPGQPG